MKKLFLTLFIIVMSVGLVFGGCAEPAPTTPAPPTAAPAPTTPAPEAPVEATKLLLSCFQAETQQWGPTIKDWGDTLVERSGGRIEIEYAWSGALCALPQQLDVLYSGGCDLAWVDPTIMAPGLYPMSEISGLPWNIPKAVQGVNAVLALWKGGFMDKEYADMKVCWLTVGPGDTIKTTGKAIRTIADFEGLKLWVVSETTGERVRALEAVPVALPVPEMSGALQKGVIDGIIGPKGSSGTEQMRNLVKYETSQGFGTVPKAVAMNWDSYNKLPPDMQALVDNMFDEWTIKGTEYFDTEMEKRLQEYPEYGIEQTELTPEAMAEIGTRWAPLWEEFIADSEAKGLPMRDAVDTFYRGLKEAGVDDPNYGAYTPAG